MNADLPTGNVLFYAIDANDAIVDRNRPVVGIIVLFTIEITVLSFDDARIERGRHFVRSFHVDSGGNSTRRPLAIVLCDSCLGNPPSTPYNAEETLHVLDKENIVAVVEIAGSRCSFRAYARMHSHQFVQLCL